MQPTTPISHENIQKGFTIVELLIVIVVIAILATIITISYNGIRGQAQMSAASTAASTAAKKLATYANSNANTYPLDKDALLCRKKGAWGIL